MAKVPQGKRPATSNKVERRSTTGSRRPVERDTPSRVSNGIVLEGDVGGNEEVGGKGKREGGTIAHGGDECRQGKGGQRERGD
ncbi:hypothetical protein RHMOL_Rhmol04G0178100 [Rhododendron molle]|uniref:Uncharacterized protein n=1 Tax=Rhododendron molle TaxID=49168 RepID=A0ACC0P1I5_RHOML|nr:hypothetical protein RHMOL_Rhmol04G0178100 [Rhododendron molle]